MVKPHPDILSALTAGIQAEVAAYVFYLEASKKVEDKNLAKPLSDLAIEERKHFQILERQYDSLIRSEKWISTADILKQNGLPEIGEDMTNEHKDLVDDVGRMKTAEAKGGMPYRIITISCEICIGNLKRKGDKIKEARNRPEEQRVLGRQSAAPLLERH